MTKTNVKMEQFIANLMRNFIGVSSSEEFQEAAYDDLFKDFAFIQELKQKIEKLLVK